MELYILIAKHCLKQLDKKSTAIAVTETWFNEDESDLVEIDGYEMFFFLLG